MQLEIKTTHLEMLSASELRPKWSTEPGLAFEKTPSPMPALNRYFYTAVGGEYYWVDRLPWSLARWIEWLDRPELETWILSVAGIPAGYCELESQGEGNVEIAYLGLAPEYVGQGLGGHLLSCATQRAWQTPARRVWVHTCTVDHPGALNNYLRRGFQPFREEVELKELPSRPHGPWPGCR